MKEAENNEIALLLRNLGKRKGVEPGPGNGSAGGAAAEHLDADELNSFAEGVLPPATRALYAAHLADCDRCRSLVAKLAQAAGTTVQSATERTAGFNLWHYLSGLLSPRVMRIAVPVLSLVIVAAVAFMWSRRDHSESQLARSVEPTVPSAGHVATDAAANYEQATPAPASANRTAPAEKKVTAEKQTEDTKRRARSDTDDQETTLSDANLATERAKKTAEAETSRGVAAAAPAPTVANEAGAKPQSKERDEVAKQAPQPAETVTVTRAEEKNEAKREEKDKTTSADKTASADKEDRALRRARPGGFGGLLGGMRKDGRQAETRSVGGRQFVRDDNRWVDTEYRSSAAVTTVARGSEQYRALIGDEPGLRTIAERLDGEVIVVWKGKAYRIR